RPYDADTGLQDDRERFYSPKDGRWINQDPIQADVNPYRYAGNRPTNATDPSGQFLIAQNAQSANQAKRQIKQSYGVESEILDLPGSEGRGRFYIYVSPK